MFNFFSRKVIDETIEEQRQDLIKFPEQHWSEFLDGEDRDLMLKAAGINFSIHIIADEITKYLQKEIEGLKNLNQIEINKVFFIVSYNYLFQAQRFFWENVILDEKKAVVFEKYLFDLFKKTTDIDPRPFFKDFVDYLGKGDSSREIQYIGSKICRELGKKDAFLMLSISMVFVEFLKNSFFDSMKKAWELPDKELEEMLNNLMNDKN